MSEPGFARRGAEVARYRTETSADGAPAAEEKATGADGVVGWDVPLDEYAVHVEHEGRGFSAFVSLRYGGNALGSCLHAGVNEPVPGGDYAAVLSLLLAAGAPVPQPEPHWPALVQACALARRHCPSALG